MSTTVFAFDHAHLLDHTAMRSPRRGALLGSCGHPPAASSRLAWHADHGAGGRIQPLFLG